jgi:biotin carboxyl carrier protein
MLSWVFGTGKLAPLDGITKIYSSKVSTVSAVFVKEGDAVIKGDKLCHNIIVF